MKNMKNKLLRTALSLVTACLLVLAILQGRERLRLQTPGQAASLS